MNESTRYAHNALREEIQSLSDVVAPAKLIDLLLERAFQNRATDIHFDPLPSGLRIRLRVDGLLHDIINLPEAMKNQVISRLKLMANMNITEHRYAQDGRISVTILENNRDIRVGGGPTIYGERLVLRLMPDQKSFSKLSELGLSDDQLNTVQKALEFPYGMILSVGPVGSGKTTTLYGCLEQLNLPEKSLATIEDPVERKMMGINQIQAEPNIDFGFVEALKGLLRQDPNVIMIGEIRDSETAQIASRASLTGILALSTLHANDSSSVVGIFREFGIKPLFVADSIRCIIAQRLIRKICDHCQESFDPDEVMLAELGLSSASELDRPLVRGTGCDQCFGTGYLGRTGIFEVMMNTSEIRSAILHGKSPGEIREISKQGGMLTLEDCARQKVLNGETTLNEFHRVLATQM
ncbi:MAG: type II/IV secretion system protein [Planctomycetaceae bacterium]|nr:type II/IV secretion system protein [Planctomycetaceae bacterium]